MPLSLLREADEAGQGVNFVLFNFRQVKCIPAGVESVYMILINFQSNCNMRAPAEFGCEPGNFCRFCLALLVLSSARSDARMEGVSDDPRCSQRVETKREISIE
jgi:hypothetical protein